MLYPATVRTPVLALFVVFKPARYVAVPFPLPLAPEVTLSQEALLDAVHWQPADVFTETVPL